MPFFPIFLFRFWTKSFTKSSTIFYIDASLWISSRLGLYFLSPDAFISVTHDFYIMIPERKNKRLAKSTSFKGSIENICWTYSISFSKKYWTTISVRYIVRLKNLRIFIFFNSYYVGSVKVKIFYSSLKQAINLSTIGFKYVCLKSSSNLLSCSLSFWPSYNMAYLYSYMRWVR